MVISSLKGLSPDEKKQALLRISQFVLREPSGNVRESIYRRLLEIGLFLSNKGATKLGDILDIIEKQFFGIKLEKSLAEEHFKYLEEEGAIRIENGEYLLEKKRRSQIETYSKNALDLISSREAKFIEQMKQKIGEGISEENIERLMDCFYRFIIRLVSRHIVDTAKLLVKGTLARISSATGRNLIDLSTNNINAKKLRKVAGDTLMEWMQSPDDDFVEYLFYMRQNFLCIEVLNLDPKCRMLEREAFSKKRLFLDTNILLSRILQDKFHEQTKKLIDNSRKLGCSVYVTKKTLDEFNNVLNKAKILLEGIKATPHQLSEVGNVIIRSYGKTILGGSSLSPTEYVDRFSDMEIFLKGMGIEVLDEEHEEIEELPKYSQLKEEVQRCFMKFREREKTNEVAKHDAFNLLLVKTLRESDTSKILGPDTWFLSSDRTLSCCDSFISRNFSFSESTSPVMIADLWNEIISPFLIGIATEKDLVEVLKSFVSSEFTPISEHIDAATLVELEIDWTEYDWLEIEEIQEITKQRFVLDYLSRRSESFKTDDREAIEQLRSEFNIAFSRLIGQISNRKIQQVRTKLDEKERETKTLKLSIKGHEKTEDQLRENLTLGQTLALRMRYISGIAGVCLLVIGATLIVSMKETVSTQITWAYVAFLVIGAILLLMAMAPGQVSAILGLGRKN